MKETTSIYTKQNPKLQAIFTEAGNLRLVLCLALDFAKETFMALFCNGQGDIVKKAFPVQNSPAGFT